MQQELLAKNEMKHFKRYTHGGAKYKKRRKVQRPLIPRKVTHVVFKSSKAKGEYCLYKHKQRVAHYLFKLASEQFVEVIQFVNMGNHLHLMVRFNEVDRFKNFLRTFPGILARKITGARKGHRFGKFWDGLAYTRVLLSKFEVFGLKGYFEGNHIQRELGYSERVLYLKRFNQYLYRLKRTRAAPT